MSNAKSGQVSKAAASESAGQESGEECSVHEAFSWLDKSLQGDHAAQFTALTLDVCNGVQTCLEMIQSDLLRKLQMDDDYPPILDPVCTERLLLLATASARMLSERAEERIEEMNERVRSR